ncbi:hypothetical protein [Arthrobacter sp. ISL-69]|uniref:hypothetical protein n=1 Tax=Arthrobacter sp. ISL-69 TaxID=2819113 RepID=UPI001BE5E500|nr:hypothetical protein [Arthrobacter sp. ISL-69]MBT2538966.1 hypothetical protein [Arthrobacter sp. ISL-69]
MDLLDLAERGPAQGDLEPVFGALDKDPAGSLDGVRDKANLPAEAEPERVRRDVSALTANN